MKTSKPRRRSTGVAWVPPPTCINCGERGHHFMPPSLGDEGRFICEMKALPRPEDPYVKLASYLWGRDRV
jgi:hypothetical protein